MASQHTKDRIKAASIIDLPTDEDLVVESDICVSIVPPRDALATAKRIQEACKTATARRLERKGVADLLYMDLNAISPRTTKRIASLVISGDNSVPSLTRTLSSTLSIGSSRGKSEDLKPITIRYLDGGIIGGPPSLKEDKTWKKPSIVVSGPKHDLMTRDLLTTLNIRIISDEIGAASTLKACFATFGKGIYALAIASFTTAHTAGVLTELQDHLKEVFPTMHAFLEKGLPGVPPKAYRWVEEMRQIGETFTDEGHFQPGHEGQAMFEGISEVYKLMAEDTVLGKEAIGKRKRGTTVKDVAEAMKEGIEAKRVRKNPDEKLELAWRGSWS